MSWGTFVINEPPVLDPLTHRFKENSTRLNVNRSSGGYIQRSIERLEVLTDSKLRGRKVICEALKTHGYLLRSEQREALARWCRE